MQIILRRITNRTGSPSLLKTQVRERASSRSCASAAHAGEQCLAYRQHYQGSAFHRKGKKWTDSSLCMSRGWYHSTCNLLQCAVTNKRALQKHHLPFGLHMFPKVNLLPKVWAIRVSVMVKTNVMQNTAALIQRADSTEHIQYPKMFFHSSFWNQLDFFLKPAPEWVTWNYFQASFWRLNFNVSPSYWQHPRTP